MFLPRLINVFQAAVCALVISLSVQSCSSDEVDGKLSKLATQMNTTLPKEADSVRRLERVTARKGHVLEYHFTVTASEAAVNREELKQQLTEKLISNAKTNPDMQAFRDDGVITEYHYKDESGNKLFDITINAGDYK